MSTPPGSRVIHALAVALVCVLVGGGVVGCSKTGAGATGGSGSVSASQETTAGQFPQTRPTPAQAPPPVMLTSPGSAVYSYDVWVSYAYRVLNSDVATQAFGPNEEVRVNSYVEFNRESGRALDQRLLQSRVKSIRSRGETATVAVVETWKYRYIDIKTGAYTSPVYDASYDATYTVVKGKKGWLVDAVQAKPVGAVPK